MKNRSVAILFALLILLSGVTAIGNDRIKVVGAGGYDEIRSFSEHEVVYFSLSELAQVLGGQVTWETVGHTVSYSDVGFNFKFLLGGIISES